VEISIFLLAVKANQANKTLFLYFLLGRMGLGQYSTQSAQPGLAVSKLTKLPSWVCTKDEQTKIGTYFRELDRLIELHQRKHDKLVTLKKAMLQKMFPQPGAVTPEIRFEGYKESWIEIVLNDFLKVFPSKQYIVDSVCLGRIKVIQQGSEPIFGYASGMAFQSFEEVVLFGDHTLSLYRPLEPFLLASDGVKILGNGIGLHRDYFYFLLAAYMPTSEGYKRHLGIFKKMRLFVSPDRSEQQKIGTYFRTLDELISKHAIQIRKLKQIKSACLEKMFV
jgi:type I restriction enzyme, S subunit